MKCGVDIVSIPRIEKIVKKHGSKGLLRIWTINELDCCKNKDKTYNVHSLAGRFAAKEAVSKAFGTGIGRSGVNIEEIEVVTDEYGAPEIRLLGTTKLYFEKENYTNISISISHEKDYAVAMCIIS